MTPPTGRMRHSKLKWLLLIQLLVNEQALCRAAPPLALKNTRLPGSGARVEQGPQSLLLSQSQRGPQPEERGSPAYTDPHTEDRVQSASLMVSNLREKLSGWMRHYIRVGESVSCEDLMSATTVGEPSSGLFPRGLLGLSLVPVLAVAGCSSEAQTLVLSLYDLLGVSDAQELLLEVQGLIERRLTRPTATSPPTSGAPPAEGAQTDHHLDAVIFNIQRLATAGGGEAVRGTSGARVRMELCDGWTRVNGTRLMGTAVEGTLGGLDEAVRACESLGYQCAGVTDGGLGLAGGYRAVLKKGSHVMPSDASESQCWILQCDMEVEEPPGAAAGGRAKRSPHGNCVDRREERVYNVVEWIPGVSTLYNLGTAVYYASVNCSETAKERAILSAVDLGTDALMAVTGGAAGVAGYALGAGVKTSVKAGIKYLLSSMKPEEDLIVNQYSWEEGFVIIE